MPKPMRNLGKSDVDFVMDVHAKQLKAQMVELTRKLYVRNPIQLSQKSVKPPSKSALLKSLDQKRVLAFLR